MFFRRSPLHAAAVALSSSPSSSSSLQHFSKALLRRRDGFQQPSGSSSSAFLNASAVSFMVTPTLSAALRYQSSSGSVSAERGDLEDEDEMDEQSHAGVASSNSQTASTTTSTSTDLIQQQHPGSEAPVVANTSAAAPVLPQYALQQMSKGAIPLPGANTPGLAPVTSSSAAQTASAGAAGPGLTVATPIGQTCNVLSECVVKADELRMQMRMQEQGDTTTQLITREGYEEYVEELKLSAAQEIGALVEGVKSTPALMHNAGMSELRRSLYYAITLKNKHWIEETQYDTMMKALSLEFLRRDFDGAMSSDDVLFVSTHVVTANYYNRQLWNRMEQSLFKSRAFENIELATIKGLSTKLYRSLRDARPEALDVRRKILNAMSRRVGNLANDFDLPALLGILQCYTRHDLMPRAVEPLVHRAINHINDFTPHECAALTNVIRKWGLMKLEVAERLIERMCISERMSTSMIQCSLTSIRACFSRVAEGGKYAVNSEPMKQKLRAMGEQVAARLDEVAYPSLPMLLSSLDILLQVRIYVPKKCLQNLFTQANIFIGHAVLNNGDATAGGLLGDGGSSDGLGGGPSALIPSTSSMLDFGNENRFSFDSPGANNPDVQAAIVLAMGGGGAGGGALMNRQRPRNIAHRARPITAEQARQLQGLLIHFGQDLCPELAARLKQAFRDGVFPDEASSS